MPRRRVSGARSRQPLTQPSQRTQAAQPTPSAEKSHPFEAAIHRSTMRFTTPSATVGSHRRYREGDTAIPQR